MSEVTRLVLGVDSAQAKLATATLDALTLSAKKTDTAVDALGAAAKGANAAVGAMGAAARSAVRPRSRLRGLFLDP